MNDNLMTKMNRNSSRQYDKLKSLDNLEQMVI